MTRAIASLHTLLPDAAPDAGADAAPVWLQLIPAGTFSGADGRGPYHVGNASRLIAASMKAGKLAIDVNHATDLAAPAGGASPAVGWIVELADRGPGAAGGIWGRVEWNASGRALIADQAYRGVSPVFEHQKDGAIVRLLRAALTNVPNLPQLATLHQTASGGAAPNPTPLGTMMDLDQLRAALGLADAADDVAVLAAIASQRETIAAHGRQLAAIASAAGIELDAADAAPGETLSVALAARSREPLPEITALTAQVAQLRSERARDAAVAFVDAAIRAGKPIVANRDRLIAAHMADAAGAEALVDAMPSITAGGHVVRHAAGDGDDEEPDALTVEMARKTGMDAKKVAAHRRQLQREREEREAA